MSDNKTRISREDRKIQILEAAKKLFIENGYVATTTSGIAKEAKIAEITLFRYFPTKMEIFESVIHPLLDKSASNMMRIDPSQNKDQQVYDLIEQRIDFIDKNQGLIKLLLIEHNRLELNENYIIKMSKHIKDQLIDLGISFEDKFHMRILMGALLSFLYYPVKNQNEKKIFIKNFVSLLID